VAKDIERLPYILSVYRWRGSHNLFSCCSDLPHSVVAECAGDIVMVIGIDPGLKGGICIAWPVGKWNVFPMPITGSGLDLNQIKSIITPKGVKSAKLVVIEKVHNMPREGGSSSFKFGDGFGSLKGLCVGVGLPFVLVMPQAWKRVILAGYDWKGNKDASIVYIKQKYPRLSLRPTGRCRKDSHGLADAACLAEYGVNLLSLSQAMDKKYGVRNELD